MVTGSGLDAQLGYRLETTVGTEATVNKFLEFNSESLAFDPSWVEPTGIRVGQKFKNSNRLFQSRKMVSGGFEVNFASRNMGGLLKASLGSTVTTPTLITGSSYKQVHQTGDLLGKSLTIQVGRPQSESPYTVKPHTYRGCKVTSWEFTATDNEVCKFAIEVDGWDETTATALAAASFPAGFIQDIDFSMCTTASLGGTIGGTTELTYTGGTAIASVVKSLSIKGDNALDVERYGLGNAGVKKEQLEAGVPTITGSLDIEYGTDTFYTAFKAGTSTSMRFKFEGATISESNKNTVDFIIPAVRIKKATPVVSSEAIVRQSVEFEVYANGTDNPFQATIISGDAAAI